MSVWLPTDEQVESANVTRLMRAVGAGSFAELRRWSVEEPAQFWDAVVGDLGIPFTHPYSRVLDDSRGPEWTTWFDDGAVNITAACVARWARDPHAAKRIAVVEEREDGVIRRVTFAELDDQTAALAAALVADGVRPGQAVGVYMPMVTEAVVAAYAIARIGAIFVPMFSGFAAPAVASRLRDSGAEILLTAEGTVRRGTRRPMLEVARVAVREASRVSRVVVLESFGAEARLDGERERWWRPYIEQAAASDATAETSAEDPWMIAYTSGTTGKPKGAVHVHGGFLVKISAEAAYQTDVGPGDVLFWHTDMGWIMGAWAMIGAHANGATMVIFDGSPDVPDTGRLWQIAQDHDVTTIGLSPTLIRSMRTQDPDAPSRYDLRSLRILGTAGEPIDPESDEWYRGARAGHTPVINLSGGTEVGACFLSCHPVEPIASCSLGGPALGMDVDVFDAAGAPVRGAVGELVCKQPWPGMTRGLWGDRELFLDEYWSTYPGIWRHGDWAKVEADGQWFLRGRSDDTINVAGKRVGPAEVEDALVAHSGVQEAAAVGIPDAEKGEALWCFVVPSGSSDPDLSTELGDLVAAQLGRPFKPSRVVAVDALPKTTSGKTLRRAIRAVVTGQDPGDLSTAENPQALDSIEAVVRRSEAVAG
jgi:acetyl-CoA synthetase